MLGGWLRVQAEAGPQGGRARGGGHSQGKKVIPEPTEGLLPLEAPQKVWSLHQRAEEQPGTLDGEPGRGRRSAAGVGRNSPNRWETQPQTLTAADTGRHGVRAPSTGQAEAEAQPERSGGRKAGSARPQSRGTRRQKAGPHLKPENVCLCAGHPKTLPGTSLSLQARADHRAPRGFSPR